MPNLATIKQKFKYAFIKLGGLLGILCNRIIFAFKINVFIFKLFFLSRIASILLRAALDNPDDVALVIYNKKLLEKIRIIKAKEKLVELAQKSDIEIPNIEKLDTIDAMVQAYNKALRTKFKGELHKKNYNAPQEWQEALQRLTIKLQDTNQKVMEYLTPYKAKITNRFLIKAMCCILIASYVGMLIAAPYALSAITAETLFAIFTIDIMFECAFVAYIYAVNRFFPRVFKDAKKLESETINNTIDLIDLRNGQQVGENAAQVLIEEPQNTLFWLRKNTRDYATETVTYTRDSMKELHKLCIRCLT